ncbi:MAG TPA: phosphate acetyltransferase [Elusimicrobia bacterium]|nr:MAG: phosphate acetyltransferase [Elusimicrobia bacterium GWA2_66_18]OGR70554.1 MAG: phosphate acetyltransferase [Elusimicrobia bacterium GWC2_65_9]HAZ07674.1 phosphate acetyltransferase [Elusimicrobiota bacterium]
MNATTTKPLDIIGDIRRKAAALKKRIVLPEGEEKRTLRAAALLKKDGLCVPILLGRPEVSRQVAAENGADLSGIEIVDVPNDFKFKEYAAQYFELRKHKAISEKEAEQSLRDPMVYGVMMLHNDRVDGFLSGADHATADTVRPALQIIKPAPGVRTISSFFIMIFPKPEQGDNGVLVMADCAINIDPPPTKLAGIGVSSARMAKALCGIDPRVAFLSFSTNGSTEHELAGRVKEAVRIAKEKAPDMAIDGEMQADAALVPEIGRRKFPGSKVAGRANVLIFPDLQSGNIGYKLVQRLTGAEALGPILQGFNKPANDLSRGASVDDIVNMACVTALQSDPNLRG